MRKFVFLIFFLILTIHLFAQNQIKTTSANLNLRTNPIIGKNVICVIPKGAILSVDYTNQEYNNWIKIKYNGKFGYVYSKYVIGLELKNNYNYNNSGSLIKYYTNSKGERVQSPTYYKSPPAGATAECRDGTYSFSHSRRGTCSHHGGVKRWLK
ncbi:hypothetical protein ES705_37716 [subsurface metagenome]